MAAKLTDRGPRVVAHFCAGKCDPSGIGAAKPGGRFHYRVCTACTSEVERAMTFSTSLVAVWYSIASSRSALHSAS
jgi:hypothetical protein